MDDALIVDLDGTLADVGHRLQYRNKKKGEWHRGEKGCMADDLNFWAAHMVSLYSRVANYKILLITGRCESVRDLTETWLLGYGVPWDELWMRPDGDNQKDCDLKESVYQTKILGKYNVEFVIEDRKRVCEMWRRNNLTVLQCAEGDY